MLGRRLVVLAVGATVLLAGASPARAASDPPLSIDRAAALAVLHCPPSFTRSKTPVLLVHGTGSTAAESWAHSFAKTLPGAGHDVCTIDLPARALGDIQVAAEYVVVAIEDVAGRAGRRIDVVTHSQGGLEPRWALKWFPSTQTLVDDYVSLSATHHGSADAAGVCSVGSCAPAVWQQVPGSRFLKALNAGDETPGDVSYTSIYSLTDEVVPELPPPSTSIIAGGRNIAVQDVCPGRPVNHIGALHDPVTHALVLDALDHAGAADPSRISTATCLGLVAPGLDASDAAYLQTIGLGQAGLNTIVTGPKSSAEPPLAAYVLASQTTAAAPAPAPNGPSPAAPPARPATQPAGGRQGSLPATGPSPIWGIGVAALAVSLLVRRTTRQSRR